MATPRSRQKKNSRSGIKITASLSGSSSPEVLMRRGGTCRLENKISYVLKAGKSGDTNRKPTIIAGVTLILAAKGDENGIDCADHYHYFARGGLS
jgi:hypothetical protein